jgi:hypothetical protein
MILQVNDLRQMHMFLKAQLDVKHRAFSYAVEKNIAKVESALKKAERKAKQNPAFKSDDKFDKGFLPEFAKLEGKHGRRDQGGNLLRDENDKIMPMDKEVYDKELAELNKKFPKGQATLAARIEAMKEMGETEYEIDFYKLRNEAGLPDSISARERIGLRFMFSDDLIPEEVKEDEEEEIMEGVEAPDSDDDVKEVKKSTKKK